MNTVKITELREHPQSNLIPAMNDETFDSLVSSIASSEIHQALDVKRDGDGYVILDGRNRYRAAMKLGLAEVPVNIITPDDDVLYMFDVAIERRDLTAAQRVGLVLLRSDYIASIEAESAKARKENEGRPTNEEKLVAPVQPVSSKEKMSRKTVGKIGKKSKTSARTVSQVKKAKDEAPELFDKIMSGEISAKKAEDEIRRRNTDYANADSWKQQHFNVWSAFPIEEFQNKYPGQLPAGLLRNVLYYTTEPGDTVLDVFGGGGNMGLVCKEMKRDCVAFDIAPKFKNIIQHDATKQFPKEYNGFASLAFLDPPYWKQKVGEYTELKNDLVNLELPEFYDALARVCRNAKRTLKPGGFLVLIIGASQFDGKYYDHALEMYSLLKDSFEIVQRVTAAYPTSQYMPPQMNRATESKTMLNLRTDILFLR
jgi:DNA modification methylase